jgi:hypothetical protein
MPSIHLRGRGQVMVLSCLTMLMLAFIVLASFALSNAVHEKIRLQAHADAAAFSLATLEARGMNVIAYQNRAFIATTVTMLTVHGWMALATAEIRIFYAVYNTFKYLESTEPACPIPAPPAPMPPFDCSVGTHGDHYHCTHKPLAQTNMGLIEGGIVHVAQAIRDKDRPFNDTMKKLSAGLRSIEQSQTTTLQQTLAGIGAASDVLGALTAMNFSGVPPPTSANLHAQNVAEFACAFARQNAVVASGMPACAHLKGPAAGAEPTRKLHSGMMRSATHAARTAFEKDCGNPEGWWEDLPYDPMPPKNKPRCAAALHDTLQPMNSSVSNLYRALLREPGLGDDPNATIDFRVPLYVMVADRIAMDEDDDSVFERILAVGDQSTANNAPVENTVRLNWHGHDLYPPAGADASTSFGSNPGVLGHDIGKAYLMMSGRGVGPGYWTHLPCEPATAFPPPIVLACQNSESLGATKLPTGHEAGEDHDAAHTDFEGICNPDLTTSVCYVAYWSDPNPVADHGQPSVYQAFSRALSPRMRPWELNASGQAHIEVVKGHSQRMVLRPRYGSTGGVAEPDMSYASAKAKAYFHELGNHWAGEFDWKRPPNLFDPFWRAKLHPFRADEKDEMLRVLGDSKGQAVLAGIQVNVGATNTTLGYEERE